ncbi:hypothetical protein [Pedobacter antarcticus]|uniref:Uncharacterized protein n=1 Tax=Pedobacter antarcticus TaxID=34086 RepID=A0A1I2ISZ9_9SPHI|nr:hypothetical protein [Pedobacter antarcticus]SDM53058.1 hypothetical protein SAMN04488084_1083 [Pedobacter antarcticus]SFF45394.1 hypothetical protein SAMN03003324_03959 [Pedobacter antarcticus]
MKTLQAKASAAAKQAGAGRAVKVHDFLKEKPLRNLKLLRLIENNLNILRFIGF